jgi:acetyl/propionyl-CoA carboxylase alpha subunit
MFSKVLIANRGEIAARIAKTCKRMGIETVAVYSEVEKDSVHVQACDQAVCVGPGPVRESYLNADAILDAARSTNADAIHPGYGLLSENPEFAKTVRDAGLGFIGPDAEMLTLFGDKLRARQVAHEAGVRCNPASDPVADASQAHAHAYQLGYPLLVKAVAGGGGIGMELVQEPEALADAIQRCQRRGEQAFGDVRVYLERAIDRPRHVEVQLIGDSTGHVLAFGERECSVQRRHQKLIEESPAPVFTNLHDGETVREQMLAAAISIFEQVRYQNIGTCEFLVDAHGQFYFLEVNARLQVEHAVTEMCWGIDLVELQLRMAAGEPLPPELDYKLPSGHAIEARICAENPLKNFAPSPGDVEELRWPPLPVGSVRVDSGIGVGSKVTPYYDSLVAKVIAHGPTRHQALLLLDRALGGTLVRPLQTNIEFLRSVLADHAFRAGQYDTAITQRLKPLPQ